MTFYRSCVGQLVSLVSAAKNGKPLQSEEDSILRRVILLIATNIKLPLCMLYIS